MKNKLLKILVVLAMILAAAGIGVNIYLNSLLNKIERPDLDEATEVVNEDNAEIAEEVIEEVKERKVVNLLLLGCDNDEQDPTSSSDDRSDALKVVSLDYDNQKIKITSLERDLVVYLPGKRQQYGHLNWAYWYGGATLAVQTVNYNFDLDITQYVSFSFRALEKLIDMIGGVDIYLTQAEINQQNKPLGVYGKAGTYTLDGYHAMMYCRIRYIDSDFSRMDRQNNVIKAVVSKLKEQNIFTLMDIVSKMLPYIKTNLTNDEIKDYITDVLKFDLSNIETYKEPSGEYNDIQSCPGLGGYIVRSYSGMVINLHKNIYEVEDYTPSQTVLENEERTYNKYGKFTKG